MMSTTTLLRPRWWRTSSLPMIALCVSALFLACEDNAKKPSGGNIIERDMDIPLAGNMMADMMEGGTEVDPPKSSKELRPEGTPSTRTIFLGDQLSLGVKYLTIEGSSEVGVANQAVTLRLLDNDGMDRTAAGIMGSRLQSSRVTTNAQGVATINLFAGEQETSFRIEASAPDAAPIYFSINVVQPGTGDILVRVHYDLPNGRYTYPQLHTASVSLFVNRSCDLVIADATRLSGAYFSFQDINPFSDVRNSTSANDFEDGATFNVATSIRNENGQAIAFGCVEGVSIEGGRTTEVDIDASDLPMELKGKFVTMNKFDLTDLLASSGNENLMIVADILEVLRLVGSEDPNRGSALVNLICSNYLDLDQGICTAAGFIGNTTINDLLNQIPQNLLNVLVAISDVIDIMTNMTVLGEIEFPVNYPDENNMIEAYNRWQRFRFDWRTGCMMGADCTQEFAVGAFNNSDRLIEGFFDAQVDGQEVTIFEHGMTFRYGLIALGLIETWLIPAVQGSQIGVPVPLRDILSSTFAGICTSIDNTLNNPGFCDNVLVSAVAALIEDQLGRLSFDPDQFRLQGRASLIDENTDLRIDKIIDGQWVGMIRTETLELGFNGCFVGCRDAECAAPLDTCEIEMWEQQGKADGEPIVWTFED